MLQTLSGNIWTQKTVVDYAQLQSGGPDISYTDPVTAATLNSFTFEVTPSDINNYYNGATVTVLSGTGAGQTATVSSFNGTSGVFTLTANWSSTIPDTTSVINISRYNSYKDILLFGMPANHMILAVRISTLNSFDAGSGNFVYVFVSDSNNLPSVVSTGGSLVTNVNNTYGMANLTVPVGSGDAYEYGSFYWFTFSAPGGATYIRNPLPGNPTVGSYCLPQRMDAYDLTARFAVMGPSNLVAAPTFETALNFNSNVIVGDVEITVSFVIV